MANKPVPTSAVDASDETLENNRKSRIGREKREDEKTLLSILGSKQGRAWFWRLLVKCKIYSEPFIPGEPDSTAYNLGKVGLGRELLAEAQRIGPSFYLQMVNEANEVSGAEEIHVQERARVRADAIAPEITADDQWPPLKAPGGPPGAAAPNPSK